jgi:F-type H+-transporting ATPase subunit delta
MKITKKTRQDARQLFRSCVVKDVLDEARARQAVQLIVQQKPRGYLAVLTQFARLIKLDQVRHTASIESAVPLQSAGQDNLRAELTQIYGGGLSYTFSVNPALVGGTRIQVGGDVYDGSVQARLAKLQESF